MLKDAETRDGFFTSLHNSIVTEMDKRGIFISVDGTSATAGSIITNSSVRAALQNVAEIDRIASENPNLNHQQVLEMVIQAAWAKATAAGEITGTTNVSAVVRTILADACRSDCGARECGHMSDLCGGNIACGKVVCPELQVCSEYGQCEDDITISLKRIDTHEVLDTTVEDPTSSTGTSMIFTTTDPLYRGLYTFECKTTSGAWGKDGRPADPEYRSDVWSFSDAEPAPIFYPERVVTRHQAIGWSKCASPFRVAKLPNGNHTFYVRVAEAPHVEQSTHWEIDVLKPDIAFQVNPLAVVPHDANIDFAVNATEPVLFYCDLDAGALSNPESLVIDRTCFYKASGCDFKLCNPETSTLGNTVSFAYQGLAPGRHNVTVRATDEAGNVAAMLTWLFTLDDCVEQGTCVASAPHMAAVRQCESGYYLDLDDDNVCRACDTRLDCTDGHLHCTNEVDSVCGYCNSGFDTNTGENFYDCSHVERWARKLQK